MEIVQKIIDEVAVALVPPEHFVPARINEPLLDSRMFEIFDYANAKLPSTKIGHFTNGTTLGGRNLDRLLSVPKLGFINVSLNSHEAQEHRRLMGTVYDKRGPSWQVYLTRVGDGTMRDLQFLDWCKAEFPLFAARTSPRFDWLGKTWAMDGGGANRRCSQWYQLDFLANGREALCCIDDDGRFGRGDARTENALAIYNHPTRLALREQKSRSAHPTCANCNALI